MPALAARICRSLRASVPLAEFLSSLVPFVSIGPRKSSTQEARGHNWASHHVLPAVYGEGRPRDETSIVGGEENHAARDLLRLAEAIDGNLRQDVFVQHLLRHRLHHFGVDVARAN